MDNYYNVEISDYVVTEQDKSKKDYLMAYMDHMILDLVHGKNSYRRKMMGKMRDMYEGIRDPEEYAYLTDNYGIGNSSDIKFTPIIRNRIEALLGLLSTTKFDWRISVVDPETIRISDIMRSASLLKSVYTLIEEESKRPQLQNVQGESIARVIARAQQVVEKNWRSVFEESANNLVELFTQDNDTNLTEKRKLILEDVAVVGECAYRVLPERYNRLPVPDILLPENLHYELPRDKKFIKESRRAVYVRYMTRDEILHKYGHLLQNYKEEFLSLTPISKHHVVASASELDRLSTSRNGKRTDSRFEDKANVFEVFECEWIANNKVEIDKDEMKHSLNVTGPDSIQKYEWREDRYQGARIGTDIYVNMGKSEFVKRDMKDPLKAALSFNGVRFSDRNGQPYSMVWKCKDIQDMHDIMIYHRDNLIANSGVNGSRLNVAGLPKFLGKNMMERLMKVIALRKQGIDPVDTSQEGAGTFQHYGDFRNSIDGSTIESITAVINQLDDQATKTTGVTPQMMGIIEQREAVSNVKVGVNQASLVIKNFYDHNDLILKHLLTDLISMTQMAMEDVELIGSLVGDAGARSFKLIPKNYAFSVFNIHVTSTSGEYTKLQDIKTSAMDMSRAGLISPQLAFKVIKSDSVNEVMTMIENEMNSAKADNTELMMLKQQVEELSKENKELTSKIGEIDEKRLSVEQSKVDVLREKGKMDFSIKKEKNKIDQEKNEKFMDVKKEALRLERDQLFLEVGNKNAREIKNF